MKTKVIVKVPTPELWEKVENKCFENGIGWFSGKQHNNGWDTHEEDSCIDILCYDNNMFLGYCYESWYRKNMPQFPIISAEEFLEENTFPVWTFYNPSPAVKSINQLPTEQNNVGTKTMNSLNSMMKRILDKDAQTLYKAGYINGDLQLTEKGKNVLNSIIFEINKVELVKQAQEELDEENK